MRYVTVVLIFTLFSTAGLASEPASDGELQVWGAEKAGYQFDRN